MGKKTRLAWKSIDFGLGVLLKAMVLLFVFLVVWMLAHGCALPPAAPAGAVPCGSDAECRYDEVCRFPHAGSRAVCLPGENEVDR